MVLDHTPLNCCSYTEILKQETALAVGCTEPVAIAYAVAKATSYLNGEIRHIHVNVSRNMMKNAMGAGIPSTGMAGIKLAAALGVFGGDANAKLEVLHGLTPEDVASAKTFANEHVTIALKDTSEKLFIEAVVESATEHATVVIRRDHTNITSITKNKEVIFSSGDVADHNQLSDSASYHLTVEDIYNYIQKVPLQDIGFLREAIEVNWEIAQEGIENKYGLMVGKVIYDAVLRSGTFDDACEYACSLAAAAADARMSGCVLPVVTLCGSGNQGITAIVPIIALNDYYHYSDEYLFRALALSCLITTHVKSHIGKLSSVCGCGLGSAIGVAAAVTYLHHGELWQINCAIKNVIADVSGIICDGAKAGCALKVATVLNSAFRSAKLALKGVGAGSMDGIVSKDVEACIRNIGRLGNEGMKDTDKTILDIMQHK